MPAIDGLVKSYRAHRDPVRATQMAAYMRDQFAFFGIPTPDRRRLDRDVVAGWPPPAEADLVVIATECWARPEREVQYFACDYLIRHVKRASPAFLDETRTLITTKSWWDTVDALASKIVGPLVLRYPQLVPVMDRWIDDENLWLARAAILHQLSYGPATDPERLFRHCLARAADTNFFIRKAIGWALRQYSKTDGRAVCSFVDDHAAALSPLSRREAVAWIDRRLDRA